MSLRFEQAGDLPLDIRQVLCRQSVFRFAPNELVEQLSSIVPALGQTENDSQSFEASNQRLTRSCRAADLSFDEKEHVLTTLKRYDVPYEVVDATQHLEYFRL